MFLSEGFMTTIETLPSSFIKPVVSRMLLLEEHTILFAPGRMNFEKCPI
jgi:hypothetical protein